MTRYDAYLTLHVIAAIIWLGAGFTVFLLSQRAQRSPDPAEGGRLAAISDWLAPRLFIPASLSVLVLGLLMVVDGPWSFDTLWIVLGLVGYAASFLTGILFLKPESERISAAVAEHGPTSPQARRHMRRIEIVGRIELAILFAVVVDMVAKPTADDGWLLAGGAVALAAVAVVAVATAPYRAPQAVVVPTTD
jgi:uncharacterized membrane protein